MTANQEDHLQDIKDHTVCDLNIKYRKGQREHGGDLWKKGLLTTLMPAMSEEVIDQMCYAHTIHEQLITIRNLCLDGINPTTPDFVCKSILIDIHKILMGELPDDSKQSKLL